MGEEHGGAPSAVLQALPLPPCVCWFSLGQVPCEGVGKEDGGTECRFVCFWGAFSVFWSACMFVENPSAKPIETPKEVRCREIPAKRLKNSFKTPNNSWSCLLLLLGFPCCTTGEIKKTRPPSVPHRAPTHVSPGDLTTALQFQRAVDPTAVTAAQSTPHQGTHTQRTQILHALTKWANRTALHYNCILVL